MPDRRTPDERCTASFPAKLRELELGWRLDALDGEGAWFAATVVQVGGWRYYSAHSKILSHVARPFTAIDLDSCQTVVSHESSIVITSHFQNHDCRQHVFFLVAEASPRKGT